MERRARTRVCRSIVGVHRHPAPGGPPVGTSPVFNSSTPLSSGILSGWLTSLTITPTSSGQLIGGPALWQGPGTAANDYLFSTVGDDGSTDGGQTLLTSAANTLTIDLRYAAPSCSSQTAFLSLNGLRYSVSDLCANGRENCSCIRHNLAFRSVLAESLHLQPPCSSKFFKLLCDKVILR
jgi:hypothetical protein